jgi:hypothetical protein
MKNTQKPSDEKPQIGDPKLLAELTDAINKIITSYVDFGSKDVKLSLTSLKFEVNRQPTNDIIESSFKSNNISTLIDTSIDKTNRVCILYETNQYGYTYCKKWKP